MQFEQSSPSFFGTGTNKAMSRDSTSRRSFSGRAAETGESGVMVRTRSTAFILTAWSRSKAFGHPQVHRHLRRLRETAISTASRLWTCGLRRHTAMTETPAWLDSHSKLPFGAIAEDTVEISLLHTSGGRTTVARPLIDLGFDGYARRVGTLQVVPYQVKARRNLNPSKVFQYRVPTASIHHDPNAAILFAYFPPPGPEPFPRLFAVPLPYFIAHCPREHAAAGEYFTFYAGLKGSGRSAWSPYFVDFAALQQQWLDRIPGWKTRLPVMGVEFETIPAPSGAREHRVRRKCPELYVAEHLQSAAGHQVVLAEDRVRVDAVGLLLHDLKSYRVAGLAVHSGLVTAKRRAAISFGATTFFIDQRLWLVILPSHRDGTFHDTAFLIPSGEVPELIPTIRLSNGNLGFRATIGLDPISRRYAPFAVPTRDLGRAIQEKVLG